LDGTGWKPVLLGLDVSLFRRPDAIGEVRHVCHAGVELECLEPTALSRDNLFDVGFDALMAALARLPRADTEPDGFFVLSGHADDHDWRLSGQIHELNERIWRVDLRGECPLATMEEILCMLGWPQVPVVFQIVQLGLTLGEVDFCRWASRQSAARL
jgi:hypothetical protein